MSTSERSGHPLERDIRQRLEAALGADLGDIRVHDDELADAVARAFGADAVTMGTDIYLAFGCGDPTTEEGLRLLAHEAAHAVQQATLRPEDWLAEPGTRETVDLAALEAAADVAAQRAVLAHTAPPGTPRVTPSTPDDGTPRLVQRHASWEHRLLGEQPTGDLIAIALRSADRPKILRNIRDFLGLWKDHPLDVTPAMIHARYPQIRTLTLDTSRLLVTYGELNTLPDYLPDPTVIDAQPRSVMLPILQAVRQEGYNWVDKLLDPDHYEPTQFAGAVSVPLRNSTFNLLLESYALNRLTANIGPARTNHYGALVGRNACHFAPYSWYRWQQYHLIARNLAMQAHTATDDDRKALLTSMAWRNHGYADHFLQDSFAAGHLINKTLVMQWFIEWAADRKWVPVYDWDRVGTMTTGNQPGLAAWQLYTMSNPGLVRDPQTAEEQVTALARMTTAGVRGYGGRSQAAAYVNYLAFLNSTVVQSASGVLHDYYNAMSLTVASAAHPDAFHLWGDDTLLSGGPNADLSNVAEGVQLSSEAAQRSQQALKEILRDGGTDISPQQIMDHFPTKVQSGGRMISLQDWNAGLREQANTLFPDVHYLALSFYPMIGDISVDVSGGWVWHPTPGSASAVACGADGSVWGLAKEHVNGGHMVQKWDGVRWVEQTGSAVRIAVDRTGAPWVVNEKNDLYRLTTKGWEHLPGKGTDIACGPDGSVWIVTTTRAPGGCTVARWNGRGWDDLGGGVVRIALSAEGLPWAVNDTGAIFAMNPDGAGWRSLPAKATAIAIGQNGDGIAWILTRTSIAGGYTVASWWNGAWVPVEGGAVDVAVDASNVAWLVNDGGVVFRRVVKDAGTAAAAPVIDLGAAAAQVPVVAPGSGPG